ncbi:MAG: hypothetical protein R6U27_08105 [Desulfobacterales bacterium]
MFVGIIFFSFINAYAADYIGDACWNFKRTDNTSGIIKIGISHIGGAHFLCSGVITVTEPINFQAPTFGNIELINDEIHLTLSLTGLRNNQIEVENINIGIDMIKAILNPNNLNGEYQSVGTYSGAFENSGGTLQFISCP